MDGGRRRSDQDELEQTASWGERPTIKDRALTPKAMQGALFGYVVFLAATADNCSRTASTRGRDAGSG